MNELCLIIEHMLSSSSRNPYIDQGFVVQHVQPSDHDKDINILHVEFTTPVCATHLCERQFYKWTVVDF
jgi:hypothetical protein